jgi:hypothetical protein
VSRKVKRYRNWQSQILKSFNFTEALSGLTDICGNHPALLVSSLGLVVNGVLKLFVDDVKQKKIIHIKERNN